MVVRDVLNEKGRRVISIGPGATVKEALALFVENNIGSLPVVDASGLLIGIFSANGVRPSDHTRPDPADYPTAGLRNPSHQSLPGARRLFWRKFL
jgi:CBS domain-containing protein